MASIIYQVVDTLQKNTVPLMDQSRIQNEKIPSRHHDAKQDSKEKWNHLIYGFSTYDSYRDRSIVFAKFCKQKFGIKKLNQINPEMTKAFFNERLEQVKNDDMSVHTLYADRAALKKLENGMKNRNWLSKDDSFVLSSKELNIPDRTLENRHDRGPFLLSEAEQIKELVSDQVNEYIRFSEATGARIEGCSTVRVKDVDFENNTVTLKEKGGLIRTVSFPEAYTNDLRAAVKDKSAEDKVLPSMTDDGVRKAVRVACNKLNIVNRKFHGFRAAKAKNMYEELRSKNVEEIEAKKIVSEFLGHHRPSVVLNYLVRS